MVRWVALVMVAAAVVVAVAGHMLLPPILVWLLVIMLLWAAVTIWFRTVDWRRGSIPPDHHITEAHHHRNHSRPLEPGETYTAAVRLRLAPNVPMAELMCSRLRAAGIEAFFKRVSTTAVIGAGTSDFGPAEIWVPEDRVDDAHALLGAD